MTPNLTIKPAQADDQEDVLEIEHLAFGSEEEPELVEMLLGDPSAEPTLSLIARMGEKPVGHILFTRGCFEDDPDKLNVQLLAPLAVVPEHQKQGIGGKLIKEGCGY